MKMKKFAALGLAIALTFGMSTTAMAATITVEDTVATNDYTAYKLFDAVAGEGTNVSYKIPESSTIESAPGFTDVFTTQNNGGDTYVWQKENVAASTVINWISTYVKDANLSGKTVTATNKTTIIGDLEPGYYYVASTVNGGAVVMLGTATDTATIVEKNSQSGWGDGEKTADGVSYSVGDTITYELEYENAVNYNQYKEGDVTKADKVFKYVVKDQLPAGITLNQNSITVTVNGQPLNADAPINEITKTDTGFEIEIPWARTDTVYDDNQNFVNDFYYEAPAVIKVTYTATMTSAVTAGVGLENRASINPNRAADEWQKTNTVYTGSVTVNKVDGTTREALDGAKFKIIDKATKDTAGVQYLVQDSNGKITWTNAEADGTEFTATNGVFSINGLAIGNYWLLETVAPNGYNLLQTPQHFEIKADDETTADVNELTVTTTVENNAGSNLPSTGGIGTTIFYVVGGVLVVAAVVLLVTKKRMSNRA